MIGKLKGLLEEIHEDHCVLDVNGVGYIAFCSSRTLSALSGVGQYQVLFVETHVRQDMIRLFGFHSASERVLFSLLIANVQGVGTKVALAVLSLFSPFEFAQAIALGDTALVGRVPGVGKKVAERMMTELRSKISLFTDANDVSDPIKHENSLHGSMSDAVSALSNLGYSREIAMRAIIAAGKTAGQDASSALLIKLGLKELSS